MPPHKDGGEVLAPEIQEAVPKRKELLYEGYYYDVTEWVKRHPGGRIIEFYTHSGEDATMAIQQFHQRSTKKVMSIMKSLKRRPASDKECKFSFFSKESSQCTAKITWVVFGSLVLTNSYRWLYFKHNPHIRGTIANVFYLFIVVGLDFATLKRHRALTEDFTELYRELEKDGYFKPSPGHIAYRIGELIFFAALGMYLMQQNCGACVAVGIISFALFQGRSGWLQHECGHHSLTGNSKVDRLIQAVLYGTIRITKIHKIKQISKPSSCKL